LHIFLVDVELEVSLSPKHRPTCCKSNGVQVVDPTAHVHTVKYQYPDKVLNT